MNTGQGEIHPVLMMEAEDIGVQCGLGSVRKCGMFVEWCSAGGGGYNTQGDDDGMRHGNIL